MSNEVKVVIEDGRRIISHTYKGENIYAIPNKEENQPLFECLALNSDKGVRKAVSKKQHLTKCAKTFLGFMDKFSYYDETHDKSRNWKSI